MLFSYSHDHLSITNEYSSLPTFGMYCGTRTGHSVVVVGNYSLITFHSDNDDVQRKGFLISFTTVRLGKYTNKNMQLGTS